MRTGDTVRDVSGNTYSVGQLLGRGGWARSWLVRRDGGGEALFVLKTPLWLDDVRGLSDPPAALAASREAVLDVARALEQQSGGVFSRLEGRVTLPDGVTGYLVAYHPVTLERRIQEGLGITGLLDALIATVKALRPLATSALGFHGNLRPSNIALDDRGDVILLDPASTGVRALWARLPVATHPGIPPEVAAGSGFTPGVDGYALCAALLRGVLGDDPLPPYAREGLTKGPAAHLKNRTIDRLKLEDSNPRFHQRLADRLAALVSRGLSREPNPSPPYRFARLDELLARLEEVQALVRPVANTVGKVMLDRLPSQPWFLTDEPLAFSCTVGCTTGVESHEEIGVGIAVFDQERNERLKQLDLGYTADKHPSGRFKFGFRVNGLMPGRYLLRLAFAVRDSGQPPVTAEAEAVVRPAPGWVPPPEPPPVSPLRFDSREAEDRATLSPEPDPRAAAARTAEPRAPEARAPEARAAESRAPEARAAESRASELRTAEPRLTDRDPRREPRGEPRPDPAARTLDPPVRGAPAGAREGAEGRPDPALLRTLDAPPRAEPRPDLPRSIDPFEVHRGDARATPEPRFARPGARAASPEPRLGADPPRSSPPEARAPVAPEPLRNAELRYPAEPGRGAFEPLARPPETSRSGVPEPRHARPTEPARGEPDSGRGALPLKFGPSPVAPAQPPRQEEGEPRPIPPRGEPEPVREPRDTTPVGARPDPRAPTEPTRTSSSGARTDEHPVRAATDARTDGHTLAPVEPARVVPAEARFEETPPPVPRRRDWTAEPLPGSSTPAGFEEESTNADDSYDSGEPGLISRIVHQIKNDSYLLVMTTLVGVIVLLLLALLLVKS